MALTRVRFAAGRVGQWKIDEVRVVRGETLPDASRLAHGEDAAAPPAQGASWSLEGVRSHERYTERGERESLVRVQPGLGRPESTRGALIPICKRASWWELSQDERRTIFEDRSHHIAVGAHYLPAIARRLYHARELGGPFDFLTWFEFAPENAGAFDELVARLRETEEWRYVDREVEIRVRR
jgi:chlorite dismutase